MYSDTDYSSFRKTFNAYLILSKDVDFQTNSIVNFLSGSVGGFFEFFNSKQISSEVVIFTMCPRLFQVVEPSISHLIFSSSPGTSLMLFSSIGKIKKAILFLERLQSHLTFTLRCVWLSLNDLS